MTVRPLRREAAGRYRSADGRWLFVKSPAGEWDSRVTWHTYCDDGQDAFGMASYTLREQVEDVEAELRYEASRSK